MGELSGLKGLSRSVIVNEYPHSVTRAIAIMKRDGASTAAGDDGAINVWRDDSGKYRAEFMRWMSVKGSIEVSTLKELRAWLHEWWPRMNQ